jgi:hypothetical protein
MSAKRLRSKFTSEYTDSRPCGFQSPRRPIARRLAVSSPAVTLRGFAVSGFAA